MKKLVISCSFTICHPFVIKLNIFWGPYWAYWDVFQHSIFSISNATYRRYFSSDVQIQYYSKILVVWTLLDASTHLYIRIFPFIGPSVCPIVHPSIMRFFNKLRKLSKIGIESLEKVRYGSLTATSRPKAFPCPSHFLVLMGVAGQRPRSGTKSSRMGRFSVPSVPPLGQTARHSV